MVFPVDVDAWISQLHKGPYRYALCVTGGGVSAINWLLCVPGGSRTVIEAVVPYDTQALDTYLGIPPASYCSEATARILAMRALERARWIAPGELVAGVACTASLRSDRPKRGDHRAHLSIQTDTQSWVRSLTLSKEARSREQEDELISHLLLQLLSELQGVPSQVYPELPLLPGEVVHISDEQQDTLLDAFFRGKIPAVCIYPDGRVSVDALPRLLLSGSFHPFHEGHWQLGKVASQLLDHPIAYEMTVLNADKPALSAEEVRTRLRGLAWKAPLWLTRAATFSEKADLFPRTTFVIGVDTAARIVQPRFYGGTEASRDAALNHLRRQGCRFLVAGRARNDGTFADLSTLALAPEFQELFSEITASSFRVDVSSTQLREQRK